MNDQPPVDWQTVAGWFGISTDLVSPCTAPADQPDADTPHTVSLPQTQPQTQQG